MKGSLFLPILMAFCAVQGNNAADVSTTGGSSALATSNTSAPTTSTASTPATSTTSAPTTSTTSAPATSTTSVPATNTPSALANSTISAPATSNTSAPTTSTTSTPATSTTSAPAISTTSAPAISTTSALANSTTSTPATSTTSASVPSGSSAPATSTTSALATSTTSASAPGGSSAPATSTTSALATSTTLASAPGGSSAPVTSTTSALATSTTSASAPGGSSAPATSTTSALATSTTLASAPGGSSAPATSTTSALATSSGYSAPATNATSTPAPGNSSAPATTTIGAPDGSSAPAASSSSVPAPSTTQELPPCAKQPCKYGATCINLLQQYVCECPYGFFYTPSGCQRGKIFPGQLNLTVPYDSEMQSITSSIYQELYNNVTQFFNVTFKGYDYQQTILVSVKSFPSTSTRLHKAETISNPEITFINMFDESTELTETNVTDIVNNALDASIFKNFKSVTQCEVYGCDAGTTVCQNPEEGHQFPTCQCKPDLAKKNPEDKVCSLCNEMCTSKNHKQCFQTEEGIPYCSCEADSELKDGKCEPCSFGYSGKDCENNVLVILIGVASACGFVILVLTGALIYKSLRATKESSSETRSLLNSDSSSTGRAPEYNTATNFAAREKIFPRVQTRNPIGVNRTVMDNQGGQARNSQEPGIANRAYVPERDYDDDNDNLWLEMSARGKF